MVRRPVIVGRGLELAELDAALDRACAGCGASVAIEGEPGIGKSSLLAELVALANDRHCVVLHGRATEFERDEPFAVFTEAFDACPPTLDGAGDRLRIQTDVRTMLGRLAEQRTVVLVLDDLHWADSASVDLFGFLVRQLPGGVLLAGALRPAQSPQRLRLAVETGAAHRDLAVIRLGPLTEHEVAELLPEADGATVAELFADSGGNPFYLEALSRASRQKSMVPSNCAGAPAPIVAALAAELRALSPVGQRAAWSAAVAGDPFDADLAGEIARFDEETLVTALDQLTVADLVRPAGIPRRFRFRHPIVRRAVYEAAGHGWRLAAHGRAAAALARRGATALARAHHVEHSAATGDLAAVESLTEAGHAAAGRAPGAAAHWFTAALRLLPHGAEHATRRAELLAPLALAAGAAGQFDASRRAVDELLALVPGELAAVRVELVAFRAFLDHVAGRPEDARALAERELLTLTPDRVEERAALLIELANNALVRSDYANLAEYSADALREAATADRPPLRAVAASQVAFSHYARGQVDAALDTLAAAADLVDQLPDDDLVTRLDAALLLSHAECNLERFADAIRHSSRGLALATGGGRVLMEPLLYVTRACGYAFSGQLAAAIADAATAYEVAVLTGSDQAASLARGISSWVHVWTGELATALRYAEEALRLGAEIGSPMTTSNVGLFRAEALLECGRLDEVRDALLATSGGVDLPLLERPWRARAHQVLIRTAIATGDLAEARHWLTQAKAALAGIPLPSRQADVLHAEARILLASKDFTAAARVALAAVAVAEQGGVPVEAGRSRILAGVAMAHCGDRRRGIDTLVTAQRDLAALGAGRYRDEATRELRRLGRRVPAYAPAERTRLSTREREIAELIATGNTNRQIASQLVISEKTVETHVSRILGKLNLASRAAVGLAIRPLAHSRE